MKSIKLKSVFLVAISMATLFSCSKEENAKEQKIPNGWETEKQN